MLARMFAGAGISTTMQDAGTGVYSSSVISMCQSPSVSFSLMRRTYAVTEKTLRSFPVRLAHLSLAVIVCAGHVSMAVTSTAVGVWCANDVSTFSLQR